MTELTMIALALLVVLIVPLVRQRRIVLPGVIIASTLTLVGLAGPLAYDLFHIQSLGIEQRIFEVPLDYMQTTLLFLLAAESAIVGDLFAGMLTQRQNLSTFHIVGLVGLGRIIVRTINSQRPWLVAAATGLPALSYIVGRGPATLISAPQYLLFSGPLVLAKIGFALLPVGMLLSALMLYSGRNGAGRSLVGAVLLGVYALTAFASASRIIVFLPIAVLIASSFQHGQLRKTSLFFALLAVTVLLPLPISLRAQTAHGLLPYSAQLYHHPAAVLTFHLSSSVNNVLIAYPLTNFVTHQHIAMGAFNASVSPLPGSLSGYASYANQLRVDYFVPYSAVGEAFAHGAALGAAYFFVAGLVFSLAWRAARSPTRDAIFRVLTLALCVLFSLQMLQYNLRTVTRFEYYLGALFVLTRLAPAARATPITSRTGGSR